MVIEGVADVSLAGLSFAGDGALVSTIDARDVTIENCRFIGGARGVVLERCSGVVRASVFRGQSDAALFALDSKGLEISGNTVSDIGTNGIMVWTSDKREDGTLVANNRISRIASVPGDTGQTGNGVSVFRAGNVIVSGNRISDCAYSAIRNNAGDNCQIINNSASRLGETALYCEFAFQGAVISNNIIEGAGNGISITNFDVGGRLATCNGNVVRRCTGFGIFAEAQTVICGNAVEVSHRSRHCTGLGLRFENADGGEQRCRGLRTRHHLFSGGGGGATDDRQQSHHQFAARSCRGDELSRSC